MSLANEYYAVIEFLNEGGQMLYVILFFSFILWVLLLERFLFLYHGIAKQKEQFIQTWERHRCNVDAFRIRQSLQHQFSSRLRESLPLIKMLIAVIPMLGLLGTVLGMIELFDVITIEGTGDARAMASGISMATLTTMSGMAIAVITLFAYRKIEDKTERLITEFKERLALC